MASVLELIQLEKSLDELINHPRYAKIPAKQREKIKEEFKRTFSGFKEQLKQMFKTVKFEYVGIRKGLRGKDWMVFRVMKEIGDVCYQMVAYELAEDGTLRFEPVFLPNAGKKQADMMLAGIKKSMDQMVKIPNDTFTIPNDDDMKTLTQCMLNEDYAGVVALLDKHPEYLGKNITYDVQYLNSLQMLMAQASNDQETMKLNKKLTRAAQNFRKIFPGNIMPDLMLLSIYLQAEDEENFLECTSHLREAVIDDPALYWEESLFYFVHGDAETGLAKARQADKEGYRSKDAYEFLLDFVEEGSKEKEELQKMINTMGGPKFSDNG